PALSSDVPNRREHSALSGLSPRERFFLSGAYARNQLLDPLDKPRAVVTPALRPRRDRARVGAVDEHPAVELGALVRARAGLEAPHDLVDRVAMAVPRLAPDGDVTLHAATQVRDGQAALEVGKLLVVDRRELGVDEDRQRDLRLVRVSRIVANLDGTDLHRLVDLDRRQAGAVGVAHRLDEVVDELLHGGGGELLTRELACGLSQNRVTDLGDLADGHARTLARRAGMRCGPDRGRRVCADGLLDRAEASAAAARRQLALDPPRPARAAVAEAGAR